MDHLVPLGQLGHGDVLLVLFAFVVEGVYLLLCISLGGLPLLDVLCDYWVDFWPLLGLDGFEVRGFFGSGWPNHLPDVEFLMHRILNFLEHDEFVSEFMMQVQLRTILELC